MRKPTSVAQSRLIAISTFNRQCGGMKKPILSEWPCPADGSLLSMQSPWRALNTGAYVRYIASILDQIRDVGTGITNQSGGSKFVVGSGTHGGQINIHTWRSSHEMVGTSTLPFVERVDFGGF